MAESLINSIARLRVLEKGLLTRETAERLRAAKSYDECLKILTESGYGMNAERGGDELEALTGAQLHDTYALIDELMPARYRDTVAAFRMRHDLTNIKLLYKLRLRGEDAASAPLDAGGMFEGEALKKAIARGDYSQLPKKISEELEKLDVDTYRGADPAEVSSRLDRAFFSYTASHSNAFVRKYFGACADFTNMIGVLRGAPESVYLPGGEYDEAKLNEVREALASSPEKLPGILKSPLETSELKEIMRGAFEEYRRTGHVSAIERARDDHLIALASERKSDIDSPAPIIGYMLAREREAEVVRLILTAKRSGMPSSAADERSVALYG